MRIELDRGMLQKRLKVIERIVPRRAGLPHHYVVSVLCNVDGVVDLWAMNQNESYRVRLAQLADEFEDGAVAIPAQELISCVAAAPDDIVRITAEQGGTSSRIESGTARWNIESLAGVEPTDFIELEVERSGEAHTGSLRWGLEHCRYAASKSESRPSFQQLHVETDRMLAADGRRVHMEEMSGGLPTFDLPERAVDTLLEALAAESGMDTVRVGVTEDGTMRFENGTMTYYVTKMNYAFPDLDSLVFERARAQSAVVVCSVSGLVTAVKVAAVSMDEGGAVKLRITQGVIEVLGHNQRSEGRMEVRATTHNFPGAVELVVIADDLLELLGRVKAEGDDFQFTVSVGDDPGWVYIEHQGMEAAIRPVTA